MQEAIKKNDLPSYRKLRKASGKIGTEDEFYLAIELCQLEILEYLYLYNCSHDRNVAIRLAFESNNDDILDLVLFKEGNRDKVIELAILHDRMDILRTQIENRKYVLYSDVRLAVENNKNEAIEYMANKPFMADKAKSFHIIAIENNNIEVFRLLLRMKYRYDHRLITMSVVRRERTEMLEMLLKEDISDHLWSSAVVESIVFGSLACLTILLNNGHTTNRDMIDTAIAHNRLNILRYLVEDKGMKIDSIYSVKAMSKEIARYLHATYSDCVDWNYDERCTICDELKDTLTNNWEMELTDYTDYIQWLPKEVLEDTLELVDTHPMIVYVDEE